MTATSPQIAFNFDPSEAERQTDKGIQTALEKATKDDAAWKDRAYYHLWKYALNGKEFMIEDARAAIEGAGLIPSPDNARSWGGVVRRLANEGLIVRIGYQSVKNTNAHKTPATLWQIKTN